MTTPADLEREHTLLSAVARLEELRRRELVGGEDGAPPAADEELELLALSEVVARKAVLGRQLTVRAARRAGASWAQIGAALGMTKQSAWQAHTRWIEELAARYAESGVEGLDPAEAEAARALAGDADG